MRRFMFVIAVALLVASACSAEEPIEQAAAPTASAEPSDASSAGGTTLSSESCVERYSIETLKNRDYAFVGIVREIQPDAADGPDNVVFEVSTWFTGGTGDTAAKKAYGFGGGMTTSAGGASHKVGDRLLVAGDEDFLWECGFTQPYDAEVAADWDEAL